MTGVFATRLVLALTSLALTAGATVACTSTEPVAEPTDVATTATVSATTADADVTVTGAPDDLADLLTAVYADGEFAATDGVFARLADRGPGPDRVTITAATGTWKETPIAVATSGDDVTLAVDDGGWKVVGGWWPSLDAAKPVLGGTRHVLVIGSDARPDERPAATRGDSLHVVGFDQDGGGGILGIPRDSYVPIPSGGRNKINAALSLSGAAGQTAAVADHTGLPLQGYLLTGFSGYTGLVDAVGGLRIAAEAIPKLGIRAGLQTMVGKTALRYARDRYNQPDGDFGRSRNQGTILMAGAAMARDAGPLELPRLITLVDPFLISDLDAAELLTLAAHVFTVAPGKVGNEVAVGGFGTGPGGMSIVVQGGPSRALYRDLRDGNLRP